MRHLHKFLLMWVVLFIYGCATTPVKKGDNPEQVLQKACSPGGEITEAKGTVWLRAKSKEASGRFPALVVANGSGNLDLEVTNLVGGTEAHIQVRKSSYRVKIPGKKSSSKRGYGSWGGIPLHFATDLFLGRVPCPEQSLRKDSVMEITGGGELTVEVPKTLDGPPQKFTYSFKRHKNAPWVEKLKWESLGVRPVTVDFEFSRPEDETMSPLSWRAVSTEGEVKAKWRRREFTLKN